MCFRTVRIGVAVLAAATVTAAASAAPAPVAATDQAQTVGVWTPKQVDFQYQTFTVRYTCDGLQDRMRSILLQLGARPDVEVHAYGCFHSPRPEPVPGVRIRMNVLQPAGGQSADSVAAHWKTIDLQAGRDPAEFAGDCELIQQVRQHVLQLFATRNVVANTTCVPRARVIGSTELKADVLVADAGPQSAAR